MVKLLKTRKMEITINNIKIVGNADEIRSLFVGYISKGTNAKYEEKELKTVDTEEDVLGEIENINDIDIPEYEPSFSL